LDVYETCWALGERCRPGTVPTDRRLRNLISSTACDEGRETVTNLTIMEARVAELDEELHNLSLGRVKDLSLASKIIEWPGSKTGKHSQIIF